MIITNSSETTLSLADLNHLVRFNWKTLKVSKFDSQIVYSFI